MKVEQIFKYLNPLVFKGKESLEIKNIVVDSRFINPHDLFIAQVGYTVNSHNFIKDALDKGAYVLKNEDFIIPFTPTYDENNRIFTVKNTVNVLAKIAKAYFEDPDDTLTVIGITGTNGKTSTSYLCKSIFEKQGLKVGIIGTIAHIIGEKVIPAKNTTPDAFLFYSLLAQMKKEKCDVVLIEISSHALALKRCDLLQLDGALFTNLSQDHLDFHTSLQEYFNTKLGIFNLLAESKKANKIALFNGTLLQSVQIQSYIEKLHLPFYTFGLKNKISEKTALNITGKITSLSIKGTAFNVTLPTGKELTLQTLLQGEFNIENILGAIGLTLFFGANSTQIAEGIKNVTIKGRFENLTPTLPFSVIVDFAHSPDALENILKTARNLNPHKIITVFGAGGNRDALKRPKMGKVVADLSDIAIITSDNPRGENPYVIMDEIEKGVKESQNKIETYKLVNRRNAIKKALTLAKKNDIIIIAGKGHENYQIFKNKTIHFSDHEVVNELLPALNL